MPASPSPAAPRRAPSSPASDCGQSRAGSSRPERVRRSTLRACPSAPDRLLGGSRDQPVGDGHEAAVILPDAYLQLTIPRFELSHRNLPASARFVGVFPIIPRQAPLPSWALVLDGSRKIVPLTQGTVSNHDFGQLIAPTLVSLANVSEVLVVVTARGRSVVAILGPIPDNAWIASICPSNGCFQRSLPSLRMAATAV
jgi:hypothetical protein